LTENSDKAITRSLIQCSASFVVFLGYCRIVESPGHGKEGGLIPFNLWPHIIEGIKALLKEKLIVVVKSRQVGWSWLVAAYVLWLALFRQGANCLLFSRGERESIELLDKCRKIYTHLPDWMKIKMNPDSATEIGFPMMESSIKAFASTEAAGISYTGTIVVNDEWDYHPYAEANYLNAKPTIDSGGQLVGITTVDKMKPDTLAKGIFIDALEKKNAYKALFVPFDARPGRDEKWYSETKTSIPERELAGMTPDLYMEQNYPRTIEECLRSTQTVSAFDFTVLDAMMGETKNPLKLGLEGIDERIINIYRPFEQGQTYVASTDMSHGLGRDYAVTLVMKCKTGEFVADIMSQILSPEELAYQSVKLLGIYKNPKWYPEDNDWGRVVITEGIKLGYTNFGWQNDKKDKEGFHTGEQTRLDLYGALIPAINNRHLTIYNKEGLKQFYDIIRNVKKGGRIEAKSGRHDDYPTAAGIALLKSQDCLKSEWTPRAISTLTFVGDKRYPWEK
jgi:hypothetical protein